MSVSIARHCWFAVHVKTRYEKSTDLALRTKGYETFLPIRRCRRYWSDRTKQIDLPLFPGYLFCRVPSTDWLPILKTPGVLQIVGRRGLPVPVVDTEMDAIRTLVNSAVKLELWPYLTVGRPVRILHGPLAGLEGVVIDSKPPQRLVVSLHILKRSVAAEIEHAWVEPRSGHCSNTTTRKNLLLRNQGVQVTKGFKLSPQHARCKTQ